MDNNNQNSTPDKSQNDQKPVSGRREALKTLATLPVLGALAYGVYQKKKQQHYQHKVGHLFEFEDVTRPEPKAINGDTLRIGIIGFGIRGAQLLQALGFATPDYVDHLKQLAKDDPQNTRYKDFVEQDDLNVVVNGVCDIFEVYARDAAMAAANRDKQGAEGTLKNMPVIYKNYKDLLAAKDIDAVIIATPDHWHGTMTIDAVKAGKHVYIEKPLTWTVEETFMVEEAVKNSNVVFQLGHQGRQIENNQRARQIIEKGLIGKVTLLEVSTNRNDPNGAWVYDIHPEANEKTIDWKQFEGDDARVKEYLSYMNNARAERFVGPEPRGQFSLERFFRWRCWWDYSTGLSGDLLTHEYDVMNYILQLGIPHSATSSGGIYFYKDGRTVPDVLHTTFEFPERDLTLLYSATLASQFRRSPKIMGTDATIELGSSLNVIIDPASEKYREQIEQGLIKPGEPFYKYAAGKSIDAISSATEMYFAERGLLFSYVGGKKYNTTFLHMREWIDAIRHKTKVSCGIQEAMEVTLAAHMGTRAYIEGRTQFWDADKRIITSG